MKFLTLYMLISAAACNAAADYTPLSQQDESLSHRCHDNLNILHVIQGEKKTPYQIAFKSSGDDGYLACLIADPNLESFPADLAQKMVALINSDNGSKESIRTIVDDTIETHLPTELLAQGITSPKILAFFGLNASQTSACFLPTKIGANPEFLHFTSGALITLKGGYPDSDVTSESTEFYQQKHISILATRREESVIRELAIAYLQKKEFDIAVNINTTAIRDYFKAHRAARPETQQPTCCTIQ